MRACMRENVSLKAVVALRAGGCERTCVSLFLLLSREAPQDDPHL